MPAAHAISQANLHGPALPAWPCSGVDLFYQDRLSAPGQPLLLGHPLPWDYGEVFTPGRQGQGLATTWLRAVGCRSQWCVSVCNAAFNAPGAAACAEPAAVLSPPVLAPAVVPRHQHGDGGRPGQRIQQPLRHGGGCRGGWVGRRVLASEPLFGCSQQWQQRCPPPRSTGAGHQILPSLLLLGMPTALHLTPPLSCPTLHPPINCHSRRRSLWCWTTSWF